MMPSIGNHRNFILRAIVLQHEFIQARTHIPGAAESFGVQVVFKGKRVGD